MPPEDPRVERLIEELRRGFEPRENGAPLGFEERITDGVTFLEEEVGEVAQLVEGVVTAGGLAIVAAEPKVGKTWLALSLAIAVANGIEFLGQYAVPRARPVLYVASEGNRAGTQARLRGLAQGYGLEPLAAVAFVDFIWRQPVALDDEAFLEWLAGRASEYGLVIFDVLAGVWEGREDSNEDVGRLLRSLAPVTRTGATVCLVHHFGKTNDANAGRRPGQRIRGASSWHAGLDSGIYLERGKNDDRTSVTCESKDASPVEPFSFAWPDYEVDGHQPVTLDWKAGDRTMVEGHAAVPAVLQVIRDAPGLSRREIAARTSYRRGVVFEAIKLAIEAGQAYEQMVPSQDAKGRSRTRPTIVAGPPPDTLVP